MKSKDANPPVPDPLRPQRLASKKTFRALVVKVCDGDTLCVMPLDPDGAGLATEFIRLASLDAPEMSGPDRAAAVRSRDQLSLLVLRKYVEVTPTRIWRDPYHRIIARVVWMGQDLAAWSIKNGLGKRRYSDAKRRS